MFVRFARTAVAPIWLIAFALLALMWSPMTVALGALLLMVGLAGAAAMLLWRER